MTLTLVNVPDVELVSTGTYNLASGETTFTEQMLADAVAAFSDATVTAPRIKIGHTDPRFAQAIASGDLDGEPAFGVIANMHLSADRQTILGDYTNVPEWLADSLPSAYPGRSIEGGFNFTAASGRKYSLVITACSLLGVTWPGVGSLEDLQEVLTTIGEAPELVAASGGALQGGQVEQAVAGRTRRDTPILASQGTRDAIAGLDIGDVRMAFLNDCDNGQAPTVDGAGPQLWWWPRSIRVEDDGSLNLIVDDDEGHLIQIPFTVSGQDVSYGDAQMVMEQFVPVAAAAGSGGVQPHIQAESRPSTTTEVTTMDIDPAVLRTRLGLADDANEQAITEALSAAAEPVTEPAPTPAAPAVPEGMALIDQDTLATLQSGAQTAQELAAAAGRRERDDAVSAAINTGRIPVSARQRYTERWDRDAEGTRTLLTASAEDGGLAPGLIPVAQREAGHAGDGERQPAAVEAEHDQFMASHFPNQHARLHGANSRGRVRQEV